MSQWVRLDVCPMCHRPIFEGETHTQTVSYDTKEISYEDALRDLLGVISTDDLIPESVSYMRQAREALAAHPKG